MFGFDMQDTYVITAKNFVQEQWNNGMLFIILGFVLMYGETYYELLNGAWDTQQDGHGPFIVLMSFGLILWKSQQFEFRTPGYLEKISGTLLLLVGALFFILGHSQEILLFDAGSQILIIGAIFILISGLRGLKDYIFPIGFLCFSVPLPGWLLDSVTQPLKLYISDFVTTKLYEFGYPIAQNGVVIYIEQYQLLVKDACVGLNSLVSLAAVGTFYIYLIKPEKIWHTLILVGMIFPAAFAANIIRVSALILITYYFGDEAGQGFLHDFSGLVMFTSALLVFLLTDSLILMALKVYNRDRKKT